MDLTSLTLVEGLPRELIEKRLKEAQVEYKIMGKWKDPYFKSSTIELIRIGPPTRSNEEKISKILGSPHIIRTNSWFYHAGYKIELSFDISNLDGRITFQQGLLVESTRIIL